MLDQAQTAPCPAESVRVLPPVATPPARSMRNSSVHSLQVDSFMSCILASLRDLPDVAEVQVRAYVLTGTCM